jgi:hypothetical protein
LTEPRLEPASFERIDEALKKIDTTTVDIESLKRGARGDFIAQFVERNIADWTKYDAVISLVRRGAGLTSCRTRPARRIAICPSCTIWR